MDLRKVKFLRYSISILYDEGQYHHDILHPDGCIVHIVLHSITSSITSRRMYVFCIVLILIIDSFICKDLCHSDL